MTIDPNHLGDPEYVPMLNQVPPEKHEPPWWVGVAGCPTDDGMPVNGRVSGEGFVLKELFWGHPRLNEEQAMWEHSLWLCLLHIGNIMPLVGTKSYVLRELIDLACDYQWIVEDEGDQVFCCRTVCETLGINYDLLRKRCIEKFGPYKKILQEEIKKAMAVDRDTGEAFNLALDIGELSARGMARTFGVPLEKVYYLAKKRGITLPPEGVGHEPRKHRPIF